jgi:uncharacterized protein with PQ loop repeat
MDIRENDEKYILGIPYPNIEIIFGVLTFFAFVPEIYSIIKNKRVKHVSPIISLTLIIINFIFFIGGFIENLYGLMLGTIAFMIYNVLILYYNSSK